MKLIKTALFIVLIGVLWTISEMVKSNHLNHLVESGKIPYGPLPDTDRDYYSFTSLNAAFDSRLDLKRSEEFSKKEFQSLILASLDRVARENFQKYLSSTLSLSEDYQIDPFWIISVMMVESRFNFLATSPKNARGLMQIRPETAEHLYNLMGKKVSEGQLQLNLHSPLENIEMGVFYLKKLHQNFRNNYHLATIAYNVGPSKLRNWLIAKDIDTANFSYLVKVKETYKDLSKNFAQELRKRQRPFELTYVVYEQRSLSLEDSLMKIYISSLPPLPSELLLTSENLKSY
ncbi:MAG: lytic transglycosylase domain-containing protein [Bacteriovorax sp.]|nr:lytic transglycosylase domain-containing protein [Bacteriovorax sp.]